MSNTIFGEVFEGLDKFDKGKLVGIENRLEVMDFVHKSSMKQDGIEANIFNANFQNINF